MSSRSPITEWSRRRGGTPVCGSGSTSPPARSPIRPWPRASAASTYDPKRRSASSQPRATAPAPTERARPRRARPRARTRRSLGLLHDADQLLFDEPLEAVAAELATETRILDAAERQLGAVEPNPVHVDHAGFEGIRDTLCLLRVVGEDVRAEPE